MTITSRIAKGMLVVIIVTIVPHECDQLVGHVCDIIGVRARRIVLVSIAQMIYQGRVWIASPNVADATTNDPQIMNKIVGKEVIQN